jgi:hypothetical protein
LSYLDHTHLGRHTNTYAKELPWGGGGDLIIVKAATYVIQNKLQRRASTASAGCETTIPAITWLQNYALDRTAAGIFVDVTNIIIIIIIIIIIAVRRLHLLALSDSQFLAPDVISGFYSKQQFQYKLIYFWD